jgi:hypothetical protein
MKLQKGSKQAKNEKDGTVQYLFLHILTPECIHGPSIGSLAAGIAKLQSISVVSSGT